MKSIIILVFTTLLTSHIGRCQNTEKVEACEEITLVFETVFNNQKCSIYLDDTLFLQDRIQNKSPDVLAIAKSFVLPRIPNKMRIKIGIHKKQITLKEGEHYVYISRRWFFGCIKVETSSLQRKYR